MKRCSAPAGDEDRHALRERGGGALDLEDAAAVEHDVDLVLVVWLLPVGLGSDEHVDADLEPGRVCTTS